MRRRQRAVARVTADAATVHETVAAVFHDARRVGIRIDDAGAPNGWGSVRETADGARRTLRTITWTEAVERGASATEGARDAGAARAADATGLDRGCAVPTVGAAREASEERAASLGIAAGHVCCRVRGRGVGRRVRPPVGLEYVGGAPEEASASENMKASHPRMIATSPLGEGAKHVPWVELVGERRAPAVVDLDDRVTTRHEANVTARRGQHSTHGTGRVAKGALERLTEVASVESAERLGVGA
jgi:hypothetical protein